MSNITILLVEDNYLNRRLSKKVLSENGYQVLEAKNAKESLEILKKEPVMLVILDINLGESEQDGISLGKQIQDQFGLPFIYLTAYENSEIIGKALSTSPYSYITKPFKNSDLIASVAIAIRQSVNNLIYKPNILVKDGEYNVELPIEEINYLESDGNYLLVYTTKKVYKMRTSIKQILEALSPDTFIQTHRAFVVNKNKIEKFSSNTLIINNVAIPVSRNYVANIINP